MFVAVTASVYAVVLLLGHLHHEMWRDELHCWALGRHATGLWDMLTGDRRYDGHPFLWYYLLHLVSRLTRSWVALHVVTMVLAIGAAVLWLRYAPIPRALRVLLLGSYYLLYEYGVMSRSYTLGLALLFTFCALYHPRRIRYVPSAVVLGLMSATSMYGTIMALALAFFLFSQGPGRHGAPAADGRQRFVFPADWIAGLIVLTLGLLLTALTTWPPADAIYHPGPPRPVTAATVQNALLNYWMGMFPFGDLVSWNWPGGDYLFSRWRSIDPYVPWLGAGWLLAWLVALRRSPRLAMTYGLGVLLMAAAQHTIYPGGWRHLVHYFIFMVACLWLYARQTRTRAPDRLLQTLLVLNLAVQIPTGVVAFLTDWRQVFSRSAEAALFIRQHHLQDQPVVADPDDPVTPIAAILDRPFFFPVSDDTTDATVFHGGRHPPTPEQVVGHAQRLAAAAGGSSLILVNYFLGPSRPDGPTVTLLYNAAPGIMNDESCNLYQVTLPR